MALVRDEIRCYERKQGHVVCYNTMKFYFGFFLRKNQRKEIVEQKKLATISSHALVVYKCGSTCVMDENGRVVAVGQPGRVGDKSPSRFVSSLLGLSRLS